jgi:hypothetical protein
MVVAMRESRSAEKCLRLHEGKIFLSSPAPEVGSYGRLRSRSLRKILVVRPMLQAVDPELGRN